MELQTPRLTIRPIVPSDWRSIQKIWLDFHTSPFSQYDIPQCTDDEGVRARISRWAAFNSGTEHLFFAVCLRDPAETVIGYIAFNARESGYEVGYCFHSDFHGRGYAKESHLALFDLLRRRGVARLTAGTAVNNTPSVALLKSLGFRQVGTEDVSFYQDAQGKDIVFEGGIYELSI